MLKFSKKYKESQKSKPETTRHTNKVTMKFNKDSKNVIIYGVFTFLRYDCCTFVHYCYYYILKLSGNKVIAYIQELLRLCSQLFQVGNSGRSHK